MLTLSTKILLIKKINKKYHHQQKGFRLQVLLTNHQDMYKP